MARKTTTVTIARAGRDAGKVFLLTEMPATQAEKWAARAFLALAKSGVEIPDDIATAGLAGIAAVGVKAFTGVSFEAAEPLMDEMFGCVKIIPDPSKPMVVRALIEDDTEEVATRLQLRQEVLALHVDFSQLVARSKSTPAPAAGAEGS